jgi:hypothetical protein
VQLHEAEFGGPMPEAPRPRACTGGGNKKKKWERKQRLHERKRGDWRLFYRHSLRTMLRYSDRPPCGGWNARAHAHASKL